jgi:hypothetical protein
MGAYHCFSVLQMVEERGVEALLGNTASSREAPKVKGISAPPPDPAEVDKLLDDLYVNWPMLLQHNYH